MSLKQRILDDFKDAMKSQDKERMNTLRMVKSAIQEKEKEQGEEVDDQDVIKILSSQVKNRDESIEKYEEGGRGDLAEEEKREKKIIQEYLPDPLTDEELDELVEETIQEVGATDMSDMGDVMDTLMPKVRGRADGSTVNEKVRERLD